MRLPLARQLRIGIMAAILCVTSQWAIPVGTVPMTPQTLFVALSGALLGGFQGAIAVIVYLLLGACGLPVFSKFMGGFAPLVGATGGFLWSFPVLALCTGLALSRSLIAQACAALGGMLIVYAAGTAQLMAVAGLDLPSALAAAVLPFILKDIVCVLGAVALGRTLKERMDKHA